MFNSSSPLVSILMTAYNRENYIAEAIESVLASTYLNFELIIVDDRSKDQTVAIVEQYARKDDKVKLFINEKNLGDYPNRNKAATYANGEYLMYVDSDDMLLTESIEKAVGIMEKYPHAHYGLYTPLKTAVPVCFDRETAIRNHFFKEPFLMYGPVATIIKRSYFKLIKGFPEKYGPANDMYYHLKAASATDVVILPFELVYYRRHDGQEINNVQSYLHNNYLYLRDAMKELALPLTREEKKWILKKNKRRFVFSLARYIFKTRKLNVLRKTIEISGFQLKDFFEAIFQPGLKKPIA